MIPAHICIPGISYNNLPMISTEFRADLFFGFNPIFFLALRRVKGYNSDVNTAVFSLSKRMNPPVWKG